MEVNTSGSMENRSLLASEIYEELLSSKYIDIITTDILADIKGAAAYSQIRDIIIHQFLNLASDNLSGVVELKKKQIESATIGYFAEILCSDICKTIRSKLQNAYHSVLTKKVKELISVKLKCKTEEQSNGKLSEITGTLLLKRAIDIKEKEICKRIAIKNRRNQKKTKRGKQILNSLKSISRGYAQNLHDIRNNIGKTSASEKHFQQDKNTHNRASSLWNSNEANIIHKETIQNANTNSTNSCVIDKEKETNIEKSNTFTKETQRLLNNEFVSYIENLEIKQEPESDEESQLSFEVYSDDSVSSVHTSDLSSFDDTISISSEDEMGYRKRKSISFNEAKELYLDSKFSTSDQGKRRRMQDHEMLHSAQVQNL